jgi:hypothetical protein
MQQATNTSQDVTRGSGFASFNENNALGLEDLNRELHVGMAEPSATQDGMSDLYEGPAHYTPVARMRTEGEDSLGGRGVVRVAAPDPFDGNKKNFKRFKLQYGLYIAANERAFQADYQKIVFVLSYMKYGAAELWADSVVERALMEEDWGTWDGFTDRLCRAFTDTNEPKRAIDAIGALKQGERPAAEYFLRLEQLALIADLDVAFDKQILHRVEQGLNWMIVDKIYQSERLPDSYGEFKQRAINIDEMWNRRREMKKSLGLSTIAKGSEMSRRAEKGKDRERPHIKEDRAERKADPDAMDVDQRKKNRGPPTCYRCGIEGHIARYCHDNAVARKLAAEEERHGWGRDTNEDFA